MRIVLSHNKRFPHPYKLELGIHASHVSLQTPPDSGALSARFKDFCICYKLELGLSPRPEMLFCGAEFPHLRTEK